MPAEQPAQPAPAEQPATPSSQPAEQPAPDPSQAQAMPEAAQPPAQPADAASQPTSQAATPPEAQTTPPMQPAVEQPAQPQPAQPQPEAPAQPEPASQPAQTMTAPVEPAPAESTPANPAPVEAAPQKPEYETTASGLRVKIARSSAQARTVGYDDWVSVHYTGRLESGKVVDTSLQPRLERGRAVIRPFTFRIGQGYVIAGFEEGVAGMRVGEKRTLVIPPELAYGAAGARDGLVPPNATLIYEVELIGIYRPEPATEPAAPAGN